MATMGWCHEFGVEIDERCSHPMTAGAGACTCSECGTVCRGRFEGGCEAVWRRGPRHGAPARPSSESLASVSRSGANGSFNGGVRWAQAPDRKIDGASSDDEAEQAAGLRAALANLAGEVAKQAEHLDTIERHLDALAKVVGQLGVEVDDRLGRLERQARSSSARPEVIQKG